MRSRQTIIRATLALIEAEGFGAVNVSAVAKAAGVTRQTVYSIFGTKEDLVSQAVISVANDVLEEIRARVEPIRDPSAYVAEVAVLARAALRRDRVLSALLEGTAGNPVFDAGMMSRAQPVGQAVLAPLRERSSALAADEAAFRDVVELVTRLGLSVLLFESEGLASDDDLRRFFRRWVVVG